MYLLAGNILAYAALAKAYCVWYERKKKRADSADRAGELLPAFAHPETPFSTLNHQSMAPGSVRDHGVILCWLPGPDSG